MQITKIRCPKNVGGDHGHTLSEPERESCREAASALKGSFTWCDSAEGEDFWCDVYKRLYGLSQGEPLA